MLSVVKSLALQGLDGRILSIEVDISCGLPCFEIVGLPDTSIKEAKERVKTAIRNTGVEFLSRRIVVNLAPADIRKEGASLDLPIALGILIASGEIENNYLNTFLEESIFVGELSLDGSVEKINGVLPICIEAKKLGIKRIILSRKNSKEAAIVDGLEILPVDNLKQLMEYLKGEKYIEKERQKEINDKNSELYEFDFSDVKGQENVKRALEISAAGGHNCILIRKSRCWKNNVSKTISKYITRYKF